MHLIDNNNSNNVTKMMRTKMVLVMLPVAREEGTPVVRPDGTSGVWPPSHTHLSYGYGMVWYNTVSSSHTHLS